MVNYGRIPGKTRELTCMNVTSANLPSANLNSNVVIYLESKKISEAKDGEKQTEKWFV